jgi:quercetin dioxygenase-like cupin family protein
MISMLRAALLLLPAALCAQSTAVVDNPTVRILNAVDLPHKPTALHKHDFNRVMIYLDNGDQDITTDGKVEHYHWKAGDVVWSPGGPMHVSENVGAANLRIVEIEVKKPAPAAPPKRNPKLDPVAVDRSHNKLIFENDQVRVFRSKLDAGDREKWHEHAGAGRAVVLLSPVAARVEAANGDASPMNGGVGDAFWRDGAVKQHRGMNIGSRPAEMVIVEVK